MPDCTGVDIVPTLVYKPAKQLKRAALLRINIVIFKQPTGLLFWCFSGAAPANDVHVQGHILCNTVITK